MKAFYCNYPINDSISRSFAGSAYNKEWLRALKELSKPKSMCVPRFLFTILKSVTIDQEDCQIMKVTDILFHMDDESALKMFREEKDITSWNILKRFMEWKRDTLPAIIKRARLYWDVLKSAKRIGPGVTYPPIVHGFIELAPIEAKNLAGELVMLPLPDYNRELFLMLVFKFYYNHRVVMSKNDPYEYERVGEDPHYRIYKKLANRMFGFIRLIETKGFKVLNYRPRPSNDSQYSNKSLFQKFLSWADIAENPKSHLFFPIVKYYIFFHFVKRSDYTIETRLQIDSL